MRIFSARIARRLALVTALLLGFAVGRADLSSALDPVRVAPHIYQTLLENERVRVLRKTVRHGETAPLVQQPDRVTIYINPCAWMEPDGDGGERMQSFRNGDVVWTPAGSHGGGTARVVQTCGIVEVELL